LSWAAASTCSVRVIVVAAMPPTQAGTADSLTLRSLAFTGIWTLSGNGSKEISERGP
jgi:hypothetical protein